MARDSSQLVEVEVEAEGRAVAGWLPWFTFGTSRSDW